MNVNRDTVKLLVNRCGIALGSMSLVEKELLEIHTVLTELQNFAMMESQGDEEEKSDLDFFIKPPVEVYEG